MQSEAAHQKSKYENLNKYFTKRNTAKQETVNIADSLDRHASYSCESNNYSPENGKTSITYDSDSSDDDKIISSYISSEENNSLDGCRDEFIIYKSKPIVNPSLKNTNVVSIT